MKKEKNFYIVFSLVVLVSLFVPYLSEILRTFNTFIHESGHAIMTIITGNKVEEIELYKNTEGVAKSLIDSNIDGILISLSGYTATSIFILMLAYAIKKEKINWMYYATTFLAMINLVFWIRNIYGFVWITLFVLTLGYIVYKKKEWINKVMTAVLIILLIDGTRAVLDIITLSIQTPGQAGDATSLAEATMIPDVFWGVLFLIQHSVALWLAFKILKKEKKGYRR